MKKIFFYAIILTIFLAGCSKKHIPNQGYSVSKLKYSIQVGAFSNVNNAARLENRLDKKGLDAFYFKHKDGLYKVRFGNFNSKKMAEQRAKKLQSSAMISTFYIVSPEEYATSIIKTKGNQYLRKQIVKSAKRYLGVPYQWGGTSTKKGFDCSGLTMVVYRVNGLNLPRTSYTQFSRGKYVSKRQLQPGDLVFFDTMGKKRVSHVGIYVGRDRFIHAPGRGKYVKYATLSNRYFKKRYMGARRYF